ncbi:MAG: sensor histidine kinase [Gemmatimonadota bacterium]
MTAQSRIAVLRSSLSTRLFFILLGAVLLIFLGNHLVANWIRTSVVQKEVLTGAERASEFLEGSLLTEMMENNREHISDAIWRLGQDPEVEIVRIYNKRGEIAFSSDSAEIGSRVDMRAQACHACHETELPLSSPDTEDLFRIHVHPDGYRVLRLITPIRSRENCSQGCHVHGRSESILGVLDVQMSLAATDAAMLGAERLSVGVGGLIVLLLGMAVALIVHHSVYLPTQELIRGTESLAAGDLDTRLDVKRQDELGQLAESFNRMATSLERANAELRGWSDTLAARVRDKTQQLEAIHRQMVQVEKNSSLGKMAATVAHELNNPLSGILTCARLVQRRLEAEMPDGEVRERMLQSLELIRSESIRCGNIVRGLLTYARGGSHQLGPGHLHALVEQAQNLVHHHMELGSVELVADLGLADDAVVCDGEQIVQSLLALMINAVEAMPGGGTLTVSTRLDPDDDRYVQLDVSDTGHGIPHEVQDRIFDPFFSTKNETKGVGLGLAVVSGIVRRHGGTITVDSSPGSGTTFTIRLPREPEESHEVTLGAAPSLMEIGTGSQEV